MKEFLVKIFNVIWPLYSNKKINKSIRQKLDPNSVSYNLSGVLPYIENVDKITTDILKQNYEQTFEVKNKLEDKAKTNIIGITIAVTLTTAATGVLSDISIKYPSMFIQWSCFIVLLLAIIYLIAAGLLAIKVLHSDNTVSIIPISKFATSDDDLRTEYDICTESNKMRNVIRNNTIYTSYECIRNALICIFFILIISTFPYSLKHNNAHLTYAKEEYTFAYTSKSISALKIENAQSIIEKAVIEYIDYNNIVKSEGTVNIIDSENDMFIQFSIQDDNVIINNVEVYIDYKSQ